MEDINECDKIDEFMLPGFRFHPTDEELVGFYLKRKIQQKPLSIELIKPLDIYKYDPWDLPKLATTGEKEWYFYCPRDRKYRNSARPNRVTGAGFWKATGTDRPIYSSESSKCIGLKKSLVFYKGRAAKGIKTDWMMHEFRLPSVSDLVSPKKYLDKNIPANEAWAICRIFKKANSSTTQRALSHPWISPVLDTNYTSNHVINPINSFSNIQDKTNYSPLQFGFRNDVEQSSIASFSPPHFPVPNEDHLTSSHTFSSVETCEQPAAKKLCAIKDASSLLLEMSTSILGDFSNNVAEFSMFQEPVDHMQGSPGHGEDQAVSVKGQDLGQIVEDQWWTMRSTMGFPYSLSDAWKSNLVWDPSSCPSELSTNKCYT